MTLEPDPSIILLDEPTAGMSADESARFVDLLKSISQGKSLVIVEHDMDVVSSLCNRVSVLVGGQVLVSGDPEEIRKDRRVQESYLGEGYSDHA